MGRRQPPTQAVPRHPQPRLSVARRVRGARPIRPASSSSTTTLWSKASRRAGRRSTSEVESETDTDTAIAAIGGGFEVGGRNLAVWPNPSRLAFESRRPRPMWSRRRPGFAAWLFADIADRGPIGNIAYFPRHASIL